MEFVQFRQAAANIDVQLSDECRTIFVARVVERRECNMMCWDNAVYFVGGKESDTEVSALDRHETASVVMLSDSYVAWLARRLQNYKDCVRGIKEEAYTYLIRSKGNPKICLS